MTATLGSFVNALNSAFGKQTTQGAAHATEVVLLGSFVPSAEAASVSQAFHFKHEGPQSGCDYRTVAGLCSDEKRGERGLPAKNSRSIFGVRPKAPSISGTLPSR